MRIIVDRELLVQAEAAGRQDLLDLWQTCPDCGELTQTAYWRAKWDSNGAANYGVICAACPDLVETPIRDWAPENNHKD